MNDVSDVVAMLSAEGQDFEFYPTTDEIIAALVLDIQRDDGDYRRTYSSVLDVGAGNGKVLLALRERAELRDLHAIEKSKLLCEQMDPDILIVGTEFSEQSLLSKHVDIVFSNPPYSDFENWAVKIIRQAASSVVYLVLPIRWEKSIPIRDAIRYRDAECKAIAQFDFENAQDRRARAKVHLLRIELHRDRDGDDAFDRFFREQFAHLIEKFEGDKAAESRLERRTKSKFSALVVGPSYLEALVSLYNKDIATVQSNFDLVSKLDADLLREFNVSPDSILACLKTRLAGLRTEYWHELFDHLDTITNRLTSGSRRKLLEVLHRHVHVDFTLSNAYAVIIWVIKNANGYIDSQLIESYELMVDKCNVVLYKSNQRTWVDNHWRYNRDDADPNSHYALDYRIVTHKIGGVRVTDYSFDRGLEERAADFLGDLLTLARNLGFKCSTVAGDLTRTGRENWVAGRAYEFYGTDRDGKDCLLYDVRAFKNRHLHLRLHKSFMLALNVEHGRLKGWLRSRTEAAEELRDPEAAEYFNTNARLTSNNTPLLSFQPEQAPAGPVDLFTMCPECERSYGPHYRGPCRH